MLVNSCNGTTLLSYASQLTMRHISKHTPSFLSLYYSSIYKSTNPNPSHQHTIFFIFHFVFSDFFIILIIPTSINNPPTQSFNPRYVI
ncbi:hypothetical protein QVD17_03334 [Tagetes erecta]|uniref:Uncharacterized protein n=1 Tax=Tagetes erecta TaxID=13708 RepID=A0AAD8L862_TARER|nr:hypothetical protein QVD17_03334 [Tagetes erecta]